MRLPRDRFDYSPIAHRPPWNLPKGARIAVWTIVNVEEWDIEKAMARQYLTAPQGVVTVPDVPNWAWHDYVAGGYLAISGGAGQAKAPRPPPQSTRTCGVFPTSGGPSHCGRGWEFMAHG